MSYKHIISEKKSAVQWITINHPERHNSFDHATIREIGDAFEDVGQDSEVGVIVLTGAGHKAFSAGGYLGDLAKFDLKQARRLFNASGRTLNLMRQVPQPVIAMVNGFAVGGGNELVICSDLAIASENARFGQTGPRIGSSPVYGATNLLAMTLGEKKSREVCYLCRQYTAQEALGLGWINAVVPASQLRAEVERWCDELLDKSPAYLELSKVTSNVWWDMLAPAMNHAQQTLLRLAGGEEMTEGASAFMAKRKPDFKRFRK
ncbi:MAG: enoyl-CoA hydratase-related protein [Bradyrhizobium sp.]